MRKSEATIAIVFFLLAQNLLASNFRNGTHLANRDTTPYTIVFEENRMSTKICECVKPTLTIKRGLSPVSAGRKVNGFIITSEKELSPGMIECTAQIDPGVTVNCLSVWPTTVKIKGIGEMRCPDGKTIIIKNKKLSIE